VTLASLAGKKTVLIFMQSSCTQCRDEMKAVAEMYDKIKDKVNVVAIGVDIEPARLTQYKSAYKIQFPILIDPDFSVPASVGVRVTPATIVLEKDGKIAQKIVGGIGRGEIEELFSKL
jgi:peroxiredoxin